MPAPERRPPRRGQFSVYLSPGQLAMLDRAARKAGMKRAEFVRELILDETWPGRGRKGLSIEMGTGSGGRPGDMSAGSAAESAPERASA